MLKKIILLIYVALLIVMGAATFVEHAHGTVVAHRAVYGAWWFALLWALLVAAGVAWIVKRRVRRWPVVGLHAALIVILLGALFTHLTARQGYIHLRQGQPTDRYTATTDGQEGETVPLPFAVRLDDFRVIHHEGSDAAADYESRITVEDGTQHTEATVAMNHIFTYRGFRFYQNTYDDDLKGSTLSVNSDPIGIPVTYTGYALLFAFLIYMLFDRRGSYRRLWQHPALQRGLLTLAILILPLTDALAGGDTPRTIPRHSAEKMGRMLVLYNGRVCPLQTYAIDFTRKLTGKGSYKGLTAEQVLAGFIFFGDEWAGERLVKVKGSALREALLLPDRCAFNDLFQGGGSTPYAGGDVSHVAPSGTYRLGPHLQRYYNGQRDDLSKQANALDERLSLIVSLRQGTTFRVFPVSAVGADVSHVAFQGAQAARLHDSSTVKWLSPVDLQSSHHHPSPNTHHPSSATQQFAESAISLLYQAALAGNWQLFDGVVDDIRTYQQRHGGASLPTATQLRAERLYNRFPFATILFMVNLTLGLLSILWFIVRLTWSQNNKESDKQREAKLGDSKGEPTCRLLLSHAVIHRLLPLLLALSWLLLTVCLALRWVIGGTVPMSNGYETMLVMAWFIELAALVVSRKQPIVVAFGLLMSGFFLLVSHITQMDPQIGRLMPVLNSPLLSIHVSIIMMAYALLSLTFVCALTAVILYGLRRLHPTSTPQAPHHHPSPTTHHPPFAALQVLSQLFLYPAITCLGIGIFIGAVWANVSWGQYWSWDPKETWALITLMVYAAALHTASLPRLRKPMTYHLFMLVAFLTVLMTYFGVNYLLGGMHSYA